MMKSLEFFNDGGSTSQAFYRSLTRVCTPEQDGAANPEMVYSWQVQYFIAEETLNLVSLLSCNRTTFFMNFLKNYLVCHPLNCIPNKAFQNKSIKESRQITLRSKLVAS